MENSINNDYINMDISSFNISVDKEPTIYNIFSFNFGAKFDSDLNVSNEKNNNVNNTFGLPTKSTINLNENKGEINQIKDDKSNKINYPNDKKKKLNKKGEIIFYGRKKKADSGTGEHNKFSDDNLRRKCKHLVLVNTFKFINEKIKKIYKGNIGHGIYVRQLLLLNQNQKANSLIQYNKDFMNKTLGEIFSEKISSRYINYNPSHNYFLIKALINDKNENNKNYFQKLFNITFIDCLKHFRGSKKIEELKGLNTFEYAKKKYKDDEDYLKSLENFIMRYEEIMNNKRTRKRKENKKD